MALCTIFLFFLQRSGQVWAASDYDRWFLVMYMASNISFNIFQLLGGNSKSIKESVESIDEENRSITFKVSDGEVLNDYKSYKFTTQAIPKGEGCLVKWTIEYEKASEDGPDPHDYLEFAVTVTKDIESHLLNA